MANKKYDDEDGVWRTIGGRRVFIKTGQSLADAMKESGKFKKSETKNPEIDKKENPYATNNKGGIDDNSSEFAEHARKHWEENNEEYKKEHDGKDDEMAKSFAERWERERKNREYGETKMKERDTKDLLKQLNDEGSDFTFDEDAKIEDGVLKTSVGVYMPGDEEDGGGYVERDLEIPLSKNETMATLEEKMRDWQERHNSPDNFYDEDFNRLKDQHDYVKHSQEEEIERQRLINDYRQNTSQKEYLQLLDDTMKKDISNEEIREKLNEAKRKSVADYDESKELEFAKKHSSEEAYNRYINDRSKWDSSMNKDLAKLENDTKDLSDYDKYNLAVSKLENKDNLSSEEKHFWNRAKMEYERQQKDREKPEDTGSTTIDKAEEERINNYNDKAKASFGKVDYYGNGRKSNAVEIEMQLKDGVFTASGSIKNARGTDSVSGGQNIDEIAELFKDNKDVQEIHSLWKKYHLNDMHAGTEKQEAALEKYKSERKSIADQMNKDAKYDWQKVSESDYNVTKKLLENHDLLVDDGYQYGTSWLKREIPIEDRKKIVNLIEKYNGKTDETATDGNQINSTLRRKGYQKYLKEHPGSKMTFEEYIKKN